jgi:hypothetical protein
MDLETYFSVVLCVWNLTISFRHQNMKERHTFFVSYMFRIIKPSSGMWHFYIHLFRLLV